MDACKGTCVSNSPRTHQPKNDQCGQQCPAMREYPDKVPASVSPSVEGGQGAGHIGVQNLQGCQGKMPASEDSTGRMFIANLPLRAAPSPYRSPSPPPPLRCCWAPAPAPPPVCDGGRAAGRAERSEAERTPPPDPIQARRGERRALVHRAPAPSDPHQISGQGLGGSGDHPPAGSEAELARVCTAVADLGLGGGGDRTGMGNEGWAGEWRGGPEPEQHEEGEHSAP